MGTRIKDYESRYNIQALITAIGVVAGATYKRRGESRFRVVVEDSDTGNEIQPQGRLFGQTDWQDIGLPIEGDTAGATVDVSDYDEIRFNCTGYATTGSGVKFIASGFFFESSSGGGGGGAVDSVNGQTGVVVLTKSSIGLGNVNNTSDLNKPISTATQTALDAKQDEISVGNLKLLATDGSGGVVALPGHEYNDLDGINFNKTVASDGTENNEQVFDKIFTVQPTADVPTGTYNLFNNNIAYTGGGFDLNPTGNAMRVMASNFSAQDTGDLGYLEFFNNNFAIGNGTDPFEWRGLAYMMGFGNINDNVTVVGPMQGYGFQWSAEAGAVFGASGTYITGFYDNVNMDCESPGYVSFNASPTLTSIRNNNNYIGFNVNSTIDTFNGNAGFSGVNVGGTYGTFNLNGYWQGVNVNPTITSARYAAGLNVSMDNVTPYAGVASSLVFQDLTFTFSQAGDNNAYTLEYTGGGTAGSEVVSIAGQDISVQIEDGVSTASQIKTAMEAVPALAAAITITISGVGSNPQTVDGPDNFTGGIQPGRVLAAYLDGDVEITGSLTFGGALSIGKLNAFASQAVVDGGGQPVSVHSLISNPTVGDNVTLSTGDTIGINTAMLLTVGDNSTVNSAFLGVAALALPAVVRIGASSTVDQVSGGTFAISLDPGAGVGGVIENLDLCRSLALPNGITTIDKMSGYKFDLPFGNPATDAWGFYESPGVNNYFAGNLLIGGTAGSDDTVTNSSVAFEVKSTTKAVVVSRMDSTAEAALTAVNGMIIYNTATNKFRGYANGTWVDLH